ncbi:hypothetical protein PITC_026550 [Penicillium italicum]|uniref:Uncharacterized protein n=1 Tax=Penicillium italicum TaxID=40296 RepID=A0A0A2L5P5_PENIT|nr:hypothetical protein PITC_026550 [Penicillium italicum]
MIVGTRERDNRGRHRHRVPGCGRPQAPVDPEMVMDKLENRRFAILMVDKRCLADLTVLCMTPKEPVVLTWGNGVTPA